MAWPKSTGPVRAAPVESTAVVDRVGVTGLTLKHSVVVLSPVGLGSDDPGTPAVSSAANTARQQYRPAEVSVTASDRTVLGLEVTALAVPTWVPPVAQLLVEVRSRGPHKENVTDELKLAMPFTVIRAESLTWIDPPLAVVGIVNPAAGMSDTVSLPALYCFGVVTVVDSHLPMVPSA